MVVTLQMQESVHDQMRIVSAQGLSLRPSFFGYDGRT